MLGLLRPVNVAVQRRKIVNFNTTLSKLDRDFFFVDDGRKFWLVLGWKRLCRSKRRSRNDSLASRRNLTYKPNHYRGSRGFRCIWRIWRKYILLLMRSLWALFGLIFMLVLWPQY